MNDFSNESSNGRKIKRKRKRANTNNEKIDGTNAALLSETVKNRKRKRKKRQSESKEVSNHLNQVAPTNLVGNTQRKRVRKRINTNKDETKKPNDNNKIDFTNESKKRPGKKSVIALVAFFIALLLIVIVYHQMSHVEMPDFVGKSIEDVKKWATDNQMAIETKDDYSSTIESGCVIKEVPSSSQFIKKKSHLTFVVSIGADPNELIQLPDFSNMTKKQVEDFIQKQKAENINIVTDSSNEVEKGKLIKVEFDDSSVSTDTYRRKDKLTVYFSNGEKKKDEKSVIPNFSNKTKADVEEWANQNKIEVTFEEVDSDLPAGSIVKMPASNQYVPNEKPIVFEISNGKGQLNETTDSSRVERNGKG